MRRMLYIAIAIVGLAGVTTAAVVTSNSSSDDCPLGGPCPMKGGKKAGMVRMMNKSALAAPESDGGGSCWKSRCSK